MIPSDSYLQLFPCCKIVNGSQKDAIYDLQREEYQLIPHALTSILEDAKTMTYGEIKAKYDKFSHILKEYIDFLIRKEYVAIDKHRLDMMDIEPDYHTFSIISNAILDFDINSKYDVKSVIEELEELRCENVELRFYDEITTKKLLEILSLFDGTSIRDVEVLLPYKNIFDLQNIEKIHLDFPRLRKLTLHKSPKKLESVNLHEEICIIYTSETITDETCCGIVNEWYMLPKTDLYLESKQYNTCLNRKIGIDRKGNIKNCPSSSLIYGKVGDTKLADIVELPQFRLYWNIKKDDIMVCKDCELRHMCQDCRIFIEDPDNIYSKPKKCSYNPYVS